MFWVRKVIFIFRWYFIQKSFQTKWVWKLFSRHMLNFILASTKPNLSRAAQKNHWNISGFIWCKIVLSTLGCKVTHKLKSIQIYSICQHIGHFTFWRTRNSLLLDSNLLNQFQFQNASKFFWNEKFVFQSSLTKHE